MTKTANAKRNIIFDLFIKLVTILVAFFSIPIYLNCLGDELFGANQLLSQLMTYINLAEAGLGASLLVALYGTLANNDTEGSVNLIAAAHRIYNYIGIFVCISATIFSFFIGNLFDIAVEHRFQVQVAFIFYSCSIGISLCMMAPTMLIRADQKYYNIAAFFLVLNPFGVIISIIFLKLGFSLISVAFSVFVANFFAYYLSNRRVKKLYPWLKLKSEHPNYKQLKSVKYVFIDKLLVVAVFQTDYILISYFISVAAVSTYAIYNTFFIVLRTFLWIPINHLQYGLGEMFYKSDLESIRRIWRDVISAGFILVGAVCITVYFQIDYFVSLWVGKEYVLDKPIVILFLINLVYLITVHPSTMVVSARNMFKERVPGSFMEMSLNLIFSVILMKKYGVFGAVLGTTIGHLSSNAWFIPYLASKILEIRFSAYWIMVLKYVLSIIAVFFIVREGRAYYGGGSWFSFFTKSSIIFLSSLFLLVITNLYSYDTRCMLRRLKAIIKL
ncbi:lipopolysaccharide biosynthesis protein [Seleniivibrio woodruffii]|uniref:lipopolysaccharide biosynthesis protein n=1 Tax=Seleniivibrio woodruffii TaxID=1078050 RepID=UPI0026EF3909|nr:hypothetical protein [Seleniivibrio woodruffii]